MKRSDENQNAELLNFYMKGFNDELHGRKKAYVKDKLCKRAYLLGREDALIGDDIPSSDYRDNSEILKQIKYG